MALSQRLEFRQTQALVMTPQLMQAIKLLQLSSLDLAAYVDAELEKNPLLERASDGDDAPAETAEPEASASESRTRLHSVRLGMRTDRSIRTPASKNHAQQRNGLSS